MESIGTLTVIGTFTQYVREEMKSRDGAAVLVYPGTYPVVAELDRRGCVADDDDAIAIIYHGRDVGTNEERSLVSTCDRNHLVDCLATKFIHLDPALPSTVADDLLAVHLEMSQHNAARRR
ncbi:MAG: hypothetical protein NVSMB59_22210 [Vulcanimicrobiaceae bacterium]